MTASSVTGDGAAADGASPSSTAPERTRLATATPPATADAACDVIVCALDHAHTLIAGLPSTSVDPLSLLGWVKHSSTTALDALAKLSDETPLGSIPAFRYATAWAGVARRELEQQLQNAQQPGAIVLTGQLALALVKARDLIEWGRRPLAEGREPCDRAPW